MNCPHCGKKVENQAVVTITPDSPECQALFAGTLNRVVCSHCRKTFTFDTPLVYRDSSTDPAYILYYMQPPEDGNTEALEQQIDGMATDVFSEKETERPVVRLVFGRPDFLEKIAIRRMGYDDRLIEYAKLELYRSIEEPKLSRTTHRLFLDYSHCDEQNLYFLIYERESQKMENVIQVAMSEFQQLMDRVREDEHIQLELEAAFPGCYVSAERLL